MRRFLQFGLCTSAALLMFALAGCGSGGMPNLGAVSGNVTIDGAPLSNVIIAFMPAEGRPATAQTDAKGFYRLEYVGGVEGCKVGPATVCFFPPTGVSPSHPIPAKYTNNSTEFKVEIKEGTNTFDFDLKSDSSSGKKGKAPQKTSATD